MYNSKREETNSNRFEFLMFSAMHLRPATVNVHRVYMELKFNVWIFHTQRKRLPNIS